MDLSSTLLFIITLSQVGTCEMTLITFYVAGGGEAVWEVEFDRLGLPSDECPILNFCRANKTKICNYEILILYDNAFILLKSFCW